MSVTRVALGVAIGLALAAGCGDPDWQASDYDIISAPLTPVYIAGTSERLACVAALADGTILTCSVGQAAEQVAALDRTGSSVVERSIANLQDDEAAVALVVANDGTIFVPTTAGNVYAIATDGSVAQLATNIAPHQFVIAAVLAADGKLAMITQVSNDGPSSIVTVDPATGAVAVVATLDSQVTAIAPAPTGGFYGTIATATAGSLFQVDLAGQVTVLRELDGERPSSVVVAPSGDVFGSTYADREGGAWSVFELTASGRFETVRRFDDRADPELIDDVQASDGWLYGLGQHDLARVAPDGTAQIVHQFPTGGVYWLALVGTSVLVVVTYLDQPDAIYRYDPE